MVIKIYFGKCNLKAMKMNLGWVFFLVEVKIFSTSSVIWLS